MTGLPKGAASYVVTPVPTVTAVQLTETTDWRAVADWCGGMIIAGKVCLVEAVAGYVADLIGLRDGVSRPDGSAAGRSDWVIRGSTGHFFTRTDAEFQRCYELAATSAAPAATDPK